MPGAERPEVERVLCVELDRPVLAKGARVGEDHLRLEKSARRKLPPHSVGRFRRRPRLSSQRSVSSRPGAPCADGRATRRALASGKPPAFELTPGSPYGSSMLVGRREQRARIDLLLDQATAGHGGALALRGEPGIGKTALLEYARERAGAARVVDTAGVETELEMPFAGLGDVLRPLLGHLDELPGSQRRDRARRSRARAGPPGRPFRARNCLSRTPCGSRLRPDAPCPRRRCALAGCGLAGSAYVHSATTQCGSGRRDLRRPRRRACAVRSARYRAG